MPNFPLRRRGDSDAAQQLLPFTGDNVTEADFASPSTLSRSHPVRARSGSTASASFLSGSYTQRAPLRSFAHHASHPSTDPPQYSSHGVRERTEELASYALDSDSYDNWDTGLGRRAPPSSYEGGPTWDSVGTDTIVEDSEPESTASTASDTAPAASATRRSDRLVPDVVVEDTETYINTERTPLLPKPHLPRTTGPPAQRRGGVKKTLSGHINTQRLRKRAGDTLAAGRKQLVRAGSHLKDPKTYTKDAALAATLSSLQMLSAVFLGLLLNILDALSYGYILFPLGVDMFSHTGPDGISIYFLSCVVAQLCYSLGLSMFRGGVGSEMIEVVPFFHNMAYSIMGRMEGQSDEAIMATVIVAYCLSSIITGLIFLSLGAFRLGNLVSFFPRHILIGCIGGVGFFLVVTGIEVSARLEGNLNYDLETLRALFARDTVYLWILPLVLSVLVIVLRRLIKSPFILPGFFIAVFAVFYIFVVILKLDLDHLRNTGWIFEKPEAGVPFYRFYSYFKFGSVDVGALLATLPTMLALSFFGIIHVPINVPALGAAAKEDNIDVNRELIAHGISNTLSGCVGSIQNYLVYANSVLFMENGGDSRVAGLFLAAATAAVWVAGPAMIGFIPVCLVGALIFLLGIELLEEALWDPFGKCHKLEYFTIVAIVLIMGVYDFVVGIFAGIVLACLSYVVQSSRTPAVRASYCGDVTESTVRRPRADRRYLSRVRNQIRVIKLSGFLFFGTIVAVEAYMRSLIEEDNFKKHLTSFIIVDFKHVTDADFSSSEGFLRINRILARKHVKMIVSGISFTSKVGQSLHNVGLFDAEKGDEDCPPPRVFEDLNMALEACENELLEAFYKHIGHHERRQVTPPVMIGPDSPSTPSGQNISIHAQSPSLAPNPLDPGLQSPRRGAQYLAAATTVREQQGAMLGSNDTTGAGPPSPSALSGKWKNFGQPVKIMLQTFEGVSEKGVDFWHIAAPYFERCEYPAGTVLYSKGDEPDGFYILERGRFRAEYELDQGCFYEVILPGTTCGELPFFSETDRTGTVAAENDSVAWLLTREKYKELEKKNRDVAGELLKVGLKLTKERLDAMTSYVLVTAS
ncbi:hypothetical protein M011DRAFT_56124 [Sporormia fimetaria CBS 119925]|uniref:Sulfate transporter family protein-like protein n=1 Tax=Sporormia fimetaria CBS 119925 TaxID=1340428 RepID=A0A6A6VC87_9PLEO|nr:hypothetical protein M011DRAFT_56124 [Sporormia fimetaria CBS 119925]